MAFIVPTGTNVNQTQLVRAIQSTLLKPSAHQSVRLTSALDTPDAVMKFVVPFLPPKLYNSETGERLLERMYRWLHGRFRFTTFFIECLIHNLFQSPHSLLDAYVFASTGYIPSDARSLTASEPPQLRGLLRLSSTINNINFEGLKEDRTSRS
ncbi:hypothetical protein GGG16DRAFT_60492 [Schizophyllum commune]